MSQATPQDEFFLDAPAVHTFIADVRRMLADHLPPDRSEAGEADIAAVLDVLQPHFAALLADQQWLPDKFAQPYAESGMGGGIATWLLFRAADRSLSLFSLVVPPGSETPIHDHLAWGFVGLYRGEQEEKVYRHTVDHTGEQAVLDVIEVNHLKPGDFYKLIPPDGDIHSVKTTSAAPSVSIHLLANDTGCVVRHAFDLTDAHSHDHSHDHSHEHRDHGGAATVRAFRSGYSNVACDTTEGGVTG